MCVQAGDGFLYGFIISDSSSAVDLRLAVCLREHSSPALLYPGHLLGEWLTCYSLTFSLVVACAHSYCSCSSGQACILILPLLFFFHEFSPMPWKLRCSLLFYHSKFCRGRWGRSIQTGLALLLLTLPFLSPKLAPWGTLPQNFHQSFCESLLRYEVHVEKPTSRYELPPTRSSWSLPSHTNMLSAANPLASQAAFFLSVLGSIISGEEVLMSYPPPSPPRSL